jgi:putative transposase
MSNPKLRIGRISERGANYAVTTITAGRRPILVGDAARCVADVLFSLERAGLATSIAWVIMPDHLHWLLELECDCLATPVRMLKSLTAMNLGKLRGAPLRVWQNGYYDHRVRAHEDLRAQAHYIVQNPIRSGLILPGQRFEHSWYRYEE